MGAESGQMLSHYRLAEKIGEGGMGVVWKAEDTVLNRTVAIKVLPVDLALDEDHRKMFLDEARLAASVSHGNIVQRIGETTTLSYRRPGRDVAAPPPVVPSPLSQHA